MSSPAFADDRRDARTRFMRWSDIDSPKRQHCVCSSGTSLSQPEKSGSTSEPTRSLRAEATVNLPEFRESWLLRRNTLAESSALVDGARLLDRLLAELDALFAAEDGELLDLNQASKERGNSADHV